MKQNTVLIGRLPFCHRQCDLIEFDAASELIFAGTGSALADLGPFRVGKEKVVCVNQ